MAGKRELIEPKGDKRYVRRDAKGRLNESDDVGRSLSTDRRKKAKSVAKPGQVRTSLSPTRTLPVANWPKALTRKSMRSSDQCSCSRLRTGNI